MPEIFVTVLIVAGLLVLVSLLQPLANRLTIPHTVLLAVLGVALGLLSAWQGAWMAEGAAGEVLTGLGSFHFEAHAILLLFLPILLFQAGLTVDVRRLVDDITPILVLAIVAVIVCTFVVGLALHAVSDVGIVVCLMLGAIVATTDPVAVIGIFRDLGAPGRLTVLVEGESLLNDAAAISLFAVLLGVLMTGQDIDLAQGMGLFAWSFLGGCAVGFVGAQVLTLLLRPLRGLPLTETTLTLSLAYMVYILAERYLGVSGVVAVVTAALVVASTGRTRVTPQTWMRLVETWEQLGFWAASLIFIFASMLVPRFLADAGAGEIVLLVVLVLAAFAARAMVLWGLLPLLSWAGLGQRVEHAYKAVILWGGLRGAVTLALALAVTENRAVSDEVKTFVATLATGFVLFTLLVNATTLRPMIRLLHLDRLSPLDRALRNRAIALALSTVAERIDTVARNYRIAPDIAGNVLESYRARQGLADADVERELDAGAEERLGLVALSNREEELYLRHHAEQTISRRTVVGLIAKAGRLRDAAKTHGREAYLAVSVASLRFRATFRAAHWLHRTLGLSAPLTTRLADRFEALLINRVVLEELLAFTRAKLNPLLGARTCGSLSEVLAERLDRTEQALEALRLQYPDYARLLEDSFLRQAALRQEDAEYRTLLAEQAISLEIFNDLERRVGADLAGVANRPRLDLGLDTPSLVRRLPMLDGLGEERLDAIAAMMAPRFAYPGERLITAGERGDAMYFVSSGAVEVKVGAERIRLGRGDFFGELALLTNRRRTASVTAIAYCRLLVLNGRDFRSFARNHPDLRARIRAVAEERLKPPPVATVG